MRYLKIERNKQVVKQYIHKREQGKPLTPRVEVSPMFREFKVPLMPRRNKEDGSSSDTKKRDLKRLRKRQLPK